MKKYLKIKNQELKLIFYISIALGFMFTTSLHIYSKPQISYFMTLTLFTCFLFLLFFLRNIFMKFIGYQNGFEIRQIMTSFDRYGFRNFDRISYYANKDSIKLGIKNPIQNKSSGKIPMPIFNVLIYVLTLGIVIFPSMWRYKIKKIPHKFLGSRSRFDKSIIYYMNPTSITNYRYGKALFGGFLFYLVFAMILKSIYNVTNSNIIAWFIFVIFWISFITLIPIIGTEGFELFKKAKIGWVCANILLFLGLLSILIFKRVDYIVMATFISFVVLLVYMFYKEMILQ